MDILTISIFGGGCGGAIVFLLLEAATACVARRNQRRALGLRVTQIMHETPLLYRFRREEEGHPGEAEVTAGDATIGQV